jgi:hypothetical protein
MAGRGPTPKPKDQRVNRVEPQRGDWQAAPGDGWLHGGVPEPPDGLLSASVDAWTVWFGAWWAAFWSPEDLPALRQVIRLYDQVERGEFQRANELRLQMDSYGITPKGQKENRWTRQSEQQQPPSSAKGQRDRKASVLKVLEGGG